MVMKICYMNSSISYPAALEEYVDNVLVRYLPLVRVSPEPEENLIKPFIN